MKPFVSVVLVVAGLLSGLFWEEGQALKQKCLSYSQVPVDLALDNAINRPLGHREFTSRAQAVADTIAWKTFMAIHWPSDQEGNPDLSACFGDKSARFVWERWQDIDRVFEGSEVQMELTKKRSAYLKSALSPSSHQAIFALTDTENKEMKAYDEVDRSWPVVDQNGNKTYFKTYYNRVMTDYISAAHLHNMEGVRAFVETFPYVNKQVELKVNDRTVPLNRIYFPMYIAGVTREKKLGTRPESTLKLTPGAGSIMIKTAWKILTPSDDASRYLVREAIVKENDTLVKVGLVAMHIVLKYAELPQGIWSTFEHTDNVPDIVNNKVVVDPHKKYNYYHASYGDQVNESPDTAGKSRLARLRPMSAAVKELNRWMHAEMRAMTGDSFWQNYNLIGSQWSQSPRLYPSDVHYTGSPEPASLANAVIENYRQRSSCIGCHAGASLQVPAGGNRPATSHSTDKVMGMTRLNR